jgi:hypothetical protein
MTAANWITIAQVVAGALMAWAGWSMRTIKACIKKDILTLESNVKGWRDGIEKRVEKVEEDVKTKASREEFLRSVAKNDRLLEKLIEGQGRIEGKIDAGSRIAAAIERLAEQKQVKA